MLLASGSVLIRGAGEHGRNRQARVRFQRMGVEQRRALQGRLSHALGVASQRQVWRAVLLVLLLPALGFPFCS